MSEKKIDETGYNFIGDDNLLGSTGDTVMIDSNESLSLLKILGLCAAMLSFQVAYAVEFALSNPLMLKLGFPDWSKALVQSSGPIAGFLVQPIIGVLSDNCKSKLGRRRPFIITGVIGVAGGFIILNFSDKIGYGISQQHGQGWSQAIFTIALAIVNIAINIVQSPSRTLIADLVPKHQQVYANTVASFMLGLASVITNLIGGVNPTKLTDGKFTNETATIIIGSIFMVIGVVITCIIAKEKPFTGIKTKTSFFKDTFRALKQMPKPVFRISVVYFFSWMAYFPFQICCTNFFINDIYGALDDKDPNYSSGLAFGMLATMVSNIFVLIYSPFQEKIFGLIGLKLTYAISQLLEVFAFTSPLYIHNKFALMFILALSGISCTIFNSVPYAIVGQSVPKEQTGMFTGVLNIFVVSGQQISNVAFQTGVGSLFPNKANKYAVIIACGGFCALISAISCYFINEPQTKDSTDIDFIKDPLLDNAEEKNR